MESNEIPIVFVAYHIASKGFTESKNAVCSKDRILACKTFYSEKIIGSFFSCVYHGQLRFHVIFYEESNLFDDEIIELVHQSIDDSGMKHGKIWLRASNHSIMNCISDRFDLLFDDEQFFYHSTEYIMRRSSFDKKHDYSVLDVKPYEETHIDKYLELLNDAMSFFIPPHDFISEKEHYLREFNCFKEKNTFEAFWKDGSLVGLYWNVGTEVDTMGVSSKFQRLGYGSMILTRAIEKVFTQNPDAEYAVLYAVGWNAKAQSFYQKYGMKTNGHLKVPYIEDAR